MKPGVESPDHFKCLFTFTVKDFLHPVLSAKNLKESGSQYVNRLFFLYSCINVIRMSHTILMVGKYRFFFNSREEIRKHVHAATADGTAKIWL